MRVLSFLDSSQNLQLGGSVLCKVTRYLSVNDCYFVHGLVNAVAVYFDFVAGLLIPMAEIFFETGSTLKI